MFAEAMGAEVVTVSGVRDVTALRKALTELHPIFHQVPYRIAVDLRVVGEDAALDEGQEIAALPPFSGG